MRLTVQITIAESMIGFLAKNLLFTQIEQVS
jgi:hypothetical protein